MLRKASVILLLVGFLAMPLSFSLPIVSHAQSDAFEFDYDYDNSYSDSFTVNGPSTTPEEDAAAIAFFMGLGAIYCCVLGLLYIYISLATQATAKKLGEGDTWMAWVPIVQNFYQVRLAGLDMWLGILLFIPVANLAIMIYVYMKIAERRGFPNWLGLLVLVPVVGIFIPGYLAWGEPSSDQVTVRPTSPTDISTPE